jgi:hypothetical protein
MAGGQRDVYGLVRSTEAENREFDPALDAKRITEIPSNMQMRAYYSANDLIYLGFAEKGISSAASGWLLQKYTYDASGKATLRQIAYDAWKDRELTTYE